MLARTHRKLLVALAICTAITVGLVLSGCSAADSDQPAAGRQEPDVTVRRMAPAQTRAEIATNFPIEVAVAEGQVLRGEAQGPSAWDYEIVVVAPPAAVAAWYRTEYERRSWELAEEQPADNGAVRLTFRKGGAESEVTVEPMAKGAGTKVRAILSTVEPVLETQ